jgi:hypothetical protein
MKGRKLETAQQKRRRYEAQGEVCLLVAASVFPLLLVLYLALGGR